MASSTETSTTTSTPSNPHPIPHFTRLLHQAILTDEILHHNYRGNGTPSNPYSVEWIPNDPVNPMNFPILKKWVMTVIMAGATFAITFASAALSGSFSEISRDFGISSELAIAGVSLFVLSYAIGPSIWAPVSWLFFSCDAPFFKLCLVQREGPRIVVSGNLLGWYSI